MSAALVGAAVVVRTLAPGGDDPVSDRPADARPYRQDADPR